jgi:ribosomal protein S18 acetylase RimI-like enzyme
MVRAATRTDAKALGAFVLRAWKEAGPAALGFTGATDEAIREISSEGFLAARLASPKVKMVVAITGDEVVGFASLKAEDQENVELSGIVVLQSESGRGVGTRLVRKSFALARKLGYRTVRVKTEAFNRRAIGFYKKNGFTETGKASERVGRTKVSLQVLQMTLR